MESRDTPASSADAERRFERLVENIPGMSAYLDIVQPDDPGHSIPVYISPQIEELLGYPRDAWLNDDELWLDQDARAMAIDAGEAASENASGSVRFCFYTQVMIVMDTDPVRASYVASEILKALNDAGFTGRIETVNALDAYLGSLPGHGYPNLRRPLISTRNIADLLPVTSVWPGLANNPCSFFPPKSPPLMWPATDGATPFRFNLHDSDVGHTLVLHDDKKGKPGKALACGTIAASNP